MIVSLSKENLTLEDFIANPPAGKEWFDGNLLEKTGMTIRHSKIQANLAYYWKSYLLESGQGGEVYVEFPCITTNQGRRPDICYLTPELVEQFGDNATLPQSPPLIAEIASPTDYAEDLFTKATEYLESGCLEVWLVFPESNRLLIITQTQTLAFHSPDEVSTEKVLLGFCISLSKLFK
jgi:Uma2 family endonuclease